MEEEDIPLAPVLEQLNSKGVLASSTSSESAYCSTFPLLFTMRTILDFNTFESEVIHGFFMHAAQNASHPTFVALCSRFIKASEFLIVESPRHDFFLFSN